MRKQVQQSREYKFQTLQMKLDRCLFRFFIIKSKHTKSYISQNSYADNTYSYAQDIMPTFGWVPRFQFQVQIGKLIANHP